MRRLHNERIGLMNYIKTKLYDTANGPGVRVTIFCAGCCHVPKCPGCFNPETYDFNAGEPFDDTVVEKLIKEANKEFISGITLLGGEPMAPSNQEGFLPFIKKFKETCPEKTIWCFSGFLWEELLDMYKKNDVTKELLPLIDVLVDGKFVEGLKDPRLIFRGSSNQRQILVKESLSSGMIKEWKPQVETII